MARSVHPTYTAADRHERRLSARQGRTDLNRRDAIAFSIAEAA